MELLQLHYFRTVAELEHMTKAAEQLRIAQPALSKTISRLEEDLGVPLFDRANRQIRLNAFGQAFLAKVEAALSLLDEGRREVMDMAGLERGTVRIATNALNRLTPSIAAFRLRYPDVSFRISQMAPTETYRIAELLEQGNVDLSFGPMSFHKPHIRELAVLYGEVYLAVPRGHRFERLSSIELTQAADEPFIEYKIGHPFREVNDEIWRSVGLERTIVCEVEEPAALGSLVQAGLGVAFVPGCRGDEPTQYTLLPIQGANNRRAYSVQWNDARYLPAAAREFQRFLAEYFSDDNK